MDWTKDKKGNATSDDKPEDDFFAEAKKKILEQMKYIIYKHVFQ